MRTYGDPTMQAPVPSPPTLLLEVKLSHGFNEVHLQPVLNTALTPALKKQAHRLLWTECVYPKLTC